MLNLKSVLSLYKTYQKEFLIIKVMVLIIINIWLLIIFWKIIALDGLNITNNNIALTKMQTIFQPVLMYLGLDILSVNTIKMLIISIIVILSNLSVLYFSQMMAFVLLGITARYSYKAYYNYINKDTLNYYGFEKEVKELTLQEKTEILTEFIKENGIKDTNLIGYLQNKISNVNIINKNELILNINNNWLDYKQQILSKIILHQKEQMDKIEIINKKAWSWETIDYWTIIKIGGGILLIAGIVIGGYYYFNNDAVKTAGEIGKKAGESAIEGTRDVSNIVIEHVNDSASIILEGSSTLTDKISKEIEETKISISNLSEIVQKINETTNLNDTKLNEFIQQVSITNQNELKESLKAQTDFIETAKLQIVENMEYNKSMKNLTDLTQKINTEVVNLNNEVLNTTLILKGGEIKELKEGTTEYIVKEIPSLINLVKDIAEKSSWNNATLAALLTFIGAPIALDTALSNEMLDYIRSTSNRENVYQRVLEHENLDGIEPEPVSGDYEDEQGSDNDL